MRSSTTYSRVFEHPGSEVDNSNGAVWVNNVMEAFNVTSDWSGLIDGLAKSKTTYIKSSGIWGGKRYWYGVQTGDLRACKVAVVNDVYCFDCVVDTVLDSYNAIEFEEGSSGMEIE